MDFKGIAKTAFLLAALGGIVVIGARFVDKLSSRV